MSKIDCILNKCIWLLHEDKNLSNLDYLSRIDGEDGAWYFWLKGVKGVYELKLKQVQEVGNFEKSNFYLRYYPDFTDECFDSYSCAEQFLRMGEIFEQATVTIAKERDLCPCCGTNQGGHEHCTEHLVLRSKGIPKLLQRKTLSQKLFVIGTVDFEISNDVLTSMVLNTSNRLQQYAVSGVQVMDKDGCVIEIVGKNELDRDVPGLNLCLPFHKFLLDKMLGVLSIKSIKQTTTKEEGTAVYNFGVGDFREKPSTEIDKIVVRDLFFAN